MADLLVIESTGRNSRFQTQFTFQIQTQTKNYNITKSQSELSQLYKYLHKKHGVTSPIRNRFLWFLTTQNWQYLYEKFLQTSFSRPEILVDSKVKIFLLE
ncbi:hypothetical protein SS50377_26391 [Spironucleus salmonicida]|uniref:Uncharacterized protein n=1 Tax=Spironucleus salmonicida TaxID=348837 RepID=V6LSX0_9EUKA|nr:hypothetical protein SS50377_26391 [Spironucleus salmonicida]|eukprot:EST47742.1 Hypothetical protein SS50377_12141 [Spironucleus salmonicida]